MTRDNNSKSCPICNTPATTAYGPFCSKRCADVDLHRWLGGNYAIPAAEEPGEWPEESLRAQRPAHHDNDN